MGISKVDSLEELDAAIEEARRHDLKLVIEAGITGREIECAVLEGRGTDAPRTSMPGEISVAGGTHEFYDFNAKYLPEEQVDLDVPAEIRTELASEVQELAIRTFEAIGCEGLARVDVFVTHQGQVVVNEINTMPGFTQHSMFPRMWAASGVPYPELVERLITLALRRPVGLR